MKMGNKSVCLLIIMVVVFFMIGGCAKKETPSINIGVLKGPSGLGAVYLMEQNALNTTAGTYNFTVAGSPDILTSQIISGILDIAALPSSTAAALYQKSAGQVLVLAVSTLGVLYVLEDGNRINSISDLAGQTIVSSGQGTTVEYVLYYLLAKFGLNAREDVVIDFVSEHAAAAALAASGNYQVVLLPEPFVTSLLSFNNEFRVAIDISAAWEETGAGVLPLGVIAVNKNFAQKNAEALAAFLCAYQDSVEYAKTYHQETAALAEKYDILAAAVAKNALPRANIVYIAGPKMSEMLDSFYRVLYDFNPAALGGVVPDNAFYYYK